MLDSTREKARTAASWRQLGKVVLGKKGPKGEPQDLDYFIIKSKVRGVYEVSKQYHEILGEKPKELSIMLAAPSLEDIFDSRATMYRGNNSRACYTHDGKTAHRYLKPEGKPGYEWTSMKCPDMECEFRLSKKCAEKNLFKNFMIQGLGIGTFIMDFGSKTAGPQMLATLQRIEAICIMEGRKDGMAGIRLKLTRTPTTFFVDYKKDGNLSKVIKAIPTLEIDFNALLGRDQTLLGPIIGQLAAPQAPLLVSPSELEAIGSDSPDSQDAKVVEE